jgi:dTDP-4-amino-4,6-dideoxygalactose transaminase
MVERLERAVARRLGVAHAAAVSSGTAALHLGLLALGVGPGDEVILPSLVCAAPLHAVLAVGAQPRVVDCDPVTGNMDPAAARRAVGHRTRALIVTHAFGLPADLAALSALGPPVIEDCAEGLGAAYRGRPAGSHGRLSVCSFYATKMVAAGEGGVVCSDRRRIVETVRDLRAYDERPVFRPRFNYKLTDLQAALALCQLARLDAFVTRRRALAAAYDRALAGLPLRLPPRPPDRVHAFHRYVVRGARAAGPILAALNRRGIAARRPIFRPLHALLGLPGFPAAAEAWRTMVSLPIYPTLPPAAVRRIAGALAEACA